MELTPETFEKAEFVERRRGGYDIDQVEAFLEEAGTEFARMLVKFQQADKQVAAARARATDLEAEVEDLRRKLAASNDRVAQAEQAVLAAQQESERAVAAAGESSGQTAGPPSDEDVASVARALVLAQEAADSALRQARSEAKSIIDDAKGRAEQQLSDTNNQIEVLLNEARARADREYADRREAVLAEVTELEVQRSSLAEIIARMDDRVEGYRNELRRTAQELVGIADDPNLMGSGDHRIFYEEPINDPEQVATPRVAAPRGVGETENSGDEISVPDGDAQLDPEPQEVPDRQPASVEVTQETLDLAAVSDGEPDDSLVDDASRGSDPDTIDPGDQGDYLDIRPTSTPAATMDVDARVVEEDEDTSGEWGPGSWAKIADSLPEEEVDPEPADVEPERAPIAATASTSTQSAVSVGRSIVDDVEDVRPTEAVDRVELIRDRYLEELDQAVNADLDSEDEALAAFLEGSSDSKARRFGWRR